MSIFLSKRVQNLKTSPTLALVGKAKDLTSKGHDVISLTVGEPDWDTYPLAAEAGIQAIQNGNTKYTAAQGTVELRKAIAENTKKTIGLVYDPLKQVVVTSGAKFSIFAALQVLCNDGDEVIIPSPYWVSYPTMVELSGGVAKLIACHEDVHFKITPEVLEKNITNKTKVFMFCSPSNPTGLIYTADELRKLADVLKKYPQVCIISDDMYNRLMFGAMPVAPHILQVAPELSDRTIVINGGSKAYAMTGWRIGWALGPVQILKAMGDYASQATGAPSSIAQAAAEVAVLHSDNEIVKTNEMLKSRLNNAIEQFTTISELKLYKPDGAFYLWVGIPALLTKSYKGKVLESSAEFCRILLEDFFVSTVPGEEFGHPGFLRLSFAIENKRMNEAVARIKKLLSQLQ